MRSLETASCLSGARQNLKKHMTLGHFDILQETVYTMIPHEVTLFAMSRRILATRQDLAMQRAASTKSELMRCGKVMVFRASGSKVYTTNQCAHH